MAAYRTIIARKGFIDQLLSRVSCNESLVGADGQWRGRVAEDEKLALEEATEQFSNEAHMNDWTFYPESVELYEMEVGDTIVGWAANAD